MFQEVQRQPLGITLLTILGALGGALLILLGLAMLGVGSVEALTAVLPLPRFVSAAFGGAGAVVLVLGAVLLAVAWGLFRGRPWAWTVSIGLVLAGLFFDLLALPGGALGVLVNLGLLWYFTREGVERWFHKEGAWPTKPVDDVLEQLAHK